MRSQLEGRHCRQQDSLNPHVARKAQTGSHLETVHDSPRHLTDWPWFSAVCVVAMALHLAYDLPQILQHDFPESAQIVNVHHKLVFVTPTVSLLLSLEQTWQGQADGRSL